jgi:hypothetical protein
MQRQKFSTERQLITVMANASISDRLESLCEEVSRVARPHKDIDSPVLEEMDSLIRLLAATGGKAKGTQDIKRDVTASISSLTNQGSEVDINQVSAAVDSASKSRIAKIEHETMAKLVNKMKDRSDLMNSMAQNQESLDALVHEDKAVADEIELKRTTAIKLMSLITRVRHSMEKEPDSPDLPPLSEVHPSLFELH